MFVCPVLKISQVKMKRRRRASHRGRDTLWQPPITPSNISPDLLCVAQRPPNYYTLNSVRIVWHNDRPSTQLGRFTGSCLLWVMSTEISVDIVVDTRSIVGRHSVDIRSTLGRYSIDTRSTHSVDSRSI